MMNLVNVTKLNYINTELNTDIISFITDELQH